MVVGNHPAIVKTCFAFFDSVPSLPAFVNWESGLIKNGGRTVPTCEINRSPIIRRKTIKSCSNYSSSSASFRIYFFGKCLKHFFCFMQGDFGKS